MLRPLSENADSQNSQNPLPGFGRCTRYPAASHKEASRFIPANAKNAAGLSGMLCVWRRSAALRLFTAQISHCLNDSKPKACIRNRRCTTPALAAHPARAFDAAAARTGIAEIASEYHEIALSPGSLTGGSVAKDLRKPLFKLYLEHANGTVRHNGEKWMSYDPLNDKTFDKTQ